MGQSVSVSVRVAGGKICEDGPVPVRGVKNVSENTE